LKKPSIVSKVVTRKTALHDRAVNPSPHFCVYAESAREIRADLGELRFLVHERRADYVLGGGGSFASSIYGRGRMSDAERTTFDEEVGKFYRKNTKQSKKRTKIKLILKVSKSQIF
jgi:hypothetical protein